MNAWFKQRFSKIPEASHRLSGPSLINNYVSEFNIKCRIYMPGNLHKPDLIEWMHLFNWKINHKAIPQSEGIRLWAGIWVFVVGFCCWNLIFFYKSIIYRICIRGGFSIQPQSSTCKTTRCHIVFCTSTFWKRTQESYWNISTVKGDSEIFLRWLLNNLRWLVLLSFESVCWLAGFNISGKQILSIFFRLGTTRGTLSHKQNYINYTFPLKGSMAN